MDDKSILMPDLYLVTPISGPYLQSLKQTLRTVTEDFKFSHGKRIRVYFRSATVPLPTPVFDVPDQHALLVTEAVFEGDENTH